MPSPSAQLVTLRPDLSQSFMQFDMALAREGFIALDVCPVIDVKEQSGNYGIIPVEQLLQTPDTKRAPRSGYKRGNVTFKPSTYNTIEYGWEEPVDENEVKMYGNYFNVELMNALRAYRFIIQGLEIDVAATFFNTTTFTGALTGAAATHWSTRATATPRDDIETACQAVFSNSGMWPNVAIMSRSLFRQCIRTDDITGLIKYSGLSDPRPENITPQALAQALNLERIIVAGQAKNTADEGQAASLSSIWDKTMCFVGRIADPDSEDFREPTVARIFHWAEDGSSIGGTAESYPDPKIRAEIIRVRQQRQVQLLYANAGYLITGCQ